MGAYTYIYGTVHNTTKEQVLNYLSHRYGTPFLADDNFLMMLPNMMVADIKEKNGDVILWTSGKWMSYKAGMERIFGFRMITDICEAFGDADIEISGDAESEKARQEHPGRIHYMKKKRPVYGEFDVKDSPSARVNRYFLNNVMEKAEDGSGIVDNRSASVMNKAYDTFGYLLTSRSRSEQRTFFNLCHIAYCFSPSKDVQNDDYWSEAATLPTALKIIDSSCFGFFFDRLTYLDADGMRKALQKAGMQDSAAYMLKVSRTLKNHDTVLRFIEKNRYNHMGVKRDISEAGMTIQLNTQRTYGWGYRNFGDLFPTLVIDENGITFDKINELEKEMAKLDYPIAARFAGYTVTEEDLRTALTLPTEEECEKYLLAHTVRSKYKSGLDSLTLAFDRKKMFVQKARTMAKRFADEQLLVAVRVPYAVKDEAKAAGAVWDAEKGTWYMKKKTALLPENHRWYPN